MKARKWVRIGCAGMLVATLAACGGGGGGGGDNTPSPPPPPTFTVGGTLSGVIGSVVLQNNGAGNLTVGANGTFTFTGSLNSGAAYNVTVLTPAALQACSVANGSGTVSANVTNVAITCADAPPTLALTLQKTKLFGFAWNSIAGSTHYRLQEDPTGSAGFTQLGADITAPATTIDQVVTLQQRLNARYIVQACAGSRCIASNTVSVTGSLADAIGYFKASNPHLAAQFGFSVALSADGKTLAVGAIGERSAARGIDGDQRDVAVAFGAVYVFVRTGNEWIQQAYVKASNADPGDEFGRVVALSGDGSILAVGARLEDSNAMTVDGNEFNNDALNSGAVYVFSRAGTAWSTQAYIKPLNTGPSDEFGGSLALSDDGRTLAVGARGEDSRFRDTDGNDPDEGLTAAGAVYVFARPFDTDRWAQQAYVKASQDASEGDLFGTSLALSADGLTLAVGAPDEDGAGTDVGRSEASDDIINSGAVYVFRLGDTGWTRQAYVKASNTDIDDAFGGAVALSANGSMLAVGAAGEDGSGIGLEILNLAPDAGAVYVFARSTDGSWGRRERYLKASNPGVNDRFGSSVAFSADGQTLVVGAVGEDSNARGIGGNQTNNSVESVGAAYAFTRSGTTWTQQAYIKASNTGVSINQQFGGAVALSGDATVLAVGARNEAGNSLGINGDENDVSLPSAGAVYLY